MWQHIAPTNYYLAAQQEPYRIGELDLRIFKKKTGIRGYQPLFAAHAYGPRSTHAVECQEKYGTADYRPV